MANEPSPAIVAVLNWRRKLQDDSGAGRAKSARLRRAASVFDALMLEETIDLIRAVRRAEPKALSSDFDHRLVVLAMTLAHIAGESKTPFGRALGQMEGDRPRLSPARFGALVRLAHAREWDGFARALRRVLAILGDMPIDVARLVRDVLFLNDATLRRWTYDYWQTRAPTDDDVRESVSNEMEAAHD